MPEAAEALLPLVPVDTLEFSQDPQPWLDAARRQHPWLGRFSQGYVIYGYDAADALMQDDRNLVTGLDSIVDFYGLRGTMWGRFMMEMVKAANGDVHRRLRSSVAHAFTPRHANLVRPLMRQVIGGLLDEWAPKGHFNFAYFASFYPVSVMCGLLGVSTEPVPRLRTAIEHHISSLTMNPETRPHFLDAWDQLWEFADTIVRERQASGERDENALLDSIIAAEESGQLLDSDETRIMLLVLFIAGYDTTKNQLTHTMKLLLDHPEMYARCAEDRDYCAKVIDEALRHSSIATPYREVAQDFAYGCHTFHKGELVVCAPPLTGREPGIFPDPLKFDPDRPNAGRHQAFGRGPHICLGQYIARATLHEGIHEIARRVRNPRLNGEIVWRNFLGAWGMLDLPIAFDPA